MCGIVYAQDFTGNPVNNGILQQFDKQRARGTEGFGLFDGLHLVRAAKEDKILKWLVKYDSDLLLFHHRKPTSTINVKRAAHPFSTKDYFGDNQYIMVHNGMVSNDDELYKKHKEMGIKYQSLLKDGTFNDSEALAWDLALTLEGKQEKLTARGGIAFVCMKLVRGKLDKLYFGRNTSPLNMYRDKKGLALSSEGPGEAIDTQKLYTFNYKLKRMTVRDFEVPRYETYKWEDKDKDYYQRKNQWGAPQLPYAVGNAVDSYLQREYGVTQSGLIEVDANGNFIDDDDYYDEPWGDLTEEQMRDIEKTVGHRQVENKVFDYLCVNSGVFESAYQQVEDDYQEVLADDPTPANYYRVYLLEKTMEELCNDPEWRGDTSVSSMWRAIWDK